MKRYFFLFLFLGVGILSLFFSPTFFKGYIPFPGDLLINTTPYKTESFLGFAPGGYPNKAQGRDVITELLPWKYFSISEFKQGKIPFWDPHNFAGNVLMQNLQSGVFYPLNALFFIASFPVAWSLFIMSQPFLAMMFMYLFLKENKFSFWESAIGAVAFAFSSYMTVWMEYGNISATMSYLPLLLLLVQKFVQSQRYRYFVGFISFSVIMILAGYIQGSFYIFSLCFFFGIFLLSQQKQQLTKTFIISFLLLFILPLFLTAFQILPTLTIFADSTRGAYSLSQIKNILLPWYYWITFFIPDFFGNPAARNYFLSRTYIETVTSISIPLVIFAVVGILKSKHVFKNFFLIVAGITFVLTTNLPGVAYFYLLPIPVMNTTVATRLLSIFIFSMIMLAMLGLAEIKQHINKKIVFGVVGCYVGLFFLEIVAQKVFPSLRNNLSISLHNSILPLFLVVSTGTVIALRSRIKRMFLPIVFLLVIIDLVYFFTKITPFAPASLLYPANPAITYIKTHQGIDRYWGYGSATIEPNFQTVEGTYTTEGNDPLHVKEIGALLSTSGTGQFPHVLPRPDANIAPGFGEGDLHANPYRQKIINLLGVKYLLHERGGIYNRYADTNTFSPDDYSLVWYGNSLQIYQNKGVLPRYFLLNRSIVASSSDDAVHKVYQTDVRNIAIVERKISLDPASTGFVHLISYESQRIQFKTQTSGRMLLFLSDTYYPSWKVLVDNQKSEMLRVDGALRGVIVPKGKHTVVMYYDATSFKQGLLVATITLLLIVGVLMLKKYGKKV